MRPRLLAAVLLAVTGALTLPAAAPAKTVTSNLVRGRVYWGAQVLPNFTRFQQMTVYGAAQGGRVAISCQSADFERSCNVPSRELPVPAGGRLDLRRAIGTRLIAGDTLDVAITDAAGRRKVVSFTAVRAAPPLRDVRCFAADGTEVACTVGCLVGADVPPGDPCENAGERIRIKRSRYDWYSRFTKTATRFTQLRFKGLPAGVDVLLLCQPPRGESCPLGARVFRPRGGRIELADSIRRLRFPPKATLDVLLLKTNVTTEVLRFTIRRNRKPALEKLCQGPADPAPRSC